jgi:hypothetical protein
MFAGLESPPSVIYSSASASIYTDPSVVKLSFAADGLAPPCFTHVSQSIWFRIFSYTG